MMKLVTIDPRMHHIAIGDGDYVEYLEEFLENGWEIVSVTCIEYTSSRERQADALLAVVLQYTDLRYSQPSQ